MKRLKNRILKLVIDKAKRSKIVQSLFEAPINVSSLNKFGEFTDQHKNTFNLYDGLRSKLRPGWERMFEKKEKLYIGNSSWYQKKVESSRITVKKVIPIIKTFTSGLTDKKILEVGCHAGAVSYALAENGAKEVVGSEFSGYKNDSLGEERNKNEINNELRLQREKFSKYFDFNQKVRFVDDDICNSALPSNYFDIVCSWDVLEHLNQPEKALRNIAKVLKSGGIAIQEYNPFFSLNGGHSLCTLDFLWGHVRINNDDFLRYLKTHRKNEVEKAYPFFVDGLNRMTIKDLKTYSQNTGLEVLSLFIFTKEQHIRMLNREILEQSQNIYPHLKPDDLVAPRIIVVHKKV
ncbi:MAG: class I SAM-dependent methyltransferase [Bacteroidetes bacterium]|nr:class I SAM-dependent methyltransferase [Bacteroidota bacterium]